VSDHPFHIVDVFAERRWAGNQLAVVLDAADLETATMQSIAREMNFSETSFVLERRPEARGYKVRIFTPVHEIPFAGHPTLGTAWVIREALAPARRDALTLELGVGPIPVTFEATGAGTELLWMRQRAPEFGPTAGADELAAALGLAPEDLDPQFPAQQVSTGLPFWIVPLRDIEAVRRCRVDAAGYERFIRTRDCQSIFVFARGAEQPGNHIHARMFSPYYGVAEDPATGSANGCLAAYLVERRVLGGLESIDLRVEQGHEMGRPSLLHLRAHKGDGDFDVRVGGSVVPVARGSLL
jgi:trans-2,3-dihydro-3-hydroxyanthranilate isomerase